MTLKMELYRLNSLGEELRAKLAGVLYDLGYMHTKDDPDVWIKPAVKTDGSEYYEIVLCYVEDVLTISDDPMKTIHGIKPVFKLKGDKEEIPEMYLGDTIQTTDTSDGITCWTISS